MTPEQGETVQNLYQLLSSLGYSIAQNVRFTTALTGQSEAVVEVIASSVLGFKKVILVLSDGSTV
jgi:hypothetical protein